MGRPKATAKQPQEFNEIVSAEKENKASKIYKEKSVELQDDKIVASIGNTINELQLAMNMKPITMSDTETVKKHTLRYLEACQQAATIPSINGLARSMGISRQGLYDYCRRNPKAETTKWLDIVRDSFANVLEESALRNNSNCVVSIFLLKALYQYQDKTVIDVNAAPQTPLDELPSCEDVEAKYSRYLNALPKEAFEDTGI